MAASPSSHLVLARKWRPERFEDLVGQEHVTRTLIQALRSGRISHAFLFTGIRGVGKTTAARILARCLNCATGPTPEPCGKCAACLEIRAGGALDAVEIDGATYRKIDDARAIIENLGYRPARDRFKIYIIDEAHQLTDQAFNALLKTLEEPPPHVKFILATTEPQKMPDTILSRLQRYDFRRIPFAAILARLRQLAELEGAATDDAALSLLAREAGGSMRDAERMLETAIASLEGQISETDVAAILGVASRSRVMEMIAAVLEKDAARALNAVRELHRRGANLESMGRDLLEVLRNLAVAKLPGADGPQSPLADLPDQEASGLKALAAQASARDLMRLFHILADAQEQLIRSPYPDLILEMALMRMATLAPVIDADELLRAIGAASASAAGGGVTAPPAPVAATGGTSSVSATAGDSSGARRIPIRGEVNASAPRRPPPPPSAALPAGTLADLPDLRDFIRSRRAALAGFMEQGAGLRVADDILTVTPRSEIYVRYLSDNKTAIAELATELYGRRIRVEMAAAAGAALSAEISAASPPAAAADPAPSASAPPVIGAADPAIPSSVERDAPSAAAPKASVQKLSSNDRDTLYADPVVKRIFSEFEARFIEIRSDPSVPRVATAEESASTKK
ncbi:MAG TPA: DNA polymerase III subunit gamma/tau [Candidatus Binataceae bacterium]|nr:DNA polymerase III subunit gamma/tau [Candidatus Binataceae bacterium]